ncbi:MAG TPA: PIN domain-containing protein [Acidobacteriota bacterium]
MPPIQDQAGGYSLGDLLIGATAAQHGATLWSNDRDFERMERLGLLKRYQPAPT